MSLVPVKLGSC